MVRHTQYEFSILDSLSRPTTPSMSTSEPEQQGQKEQPKRPEQPQKLEGLPGSRQTEKRPFDWAGSWIWESGVVVLAISCISLLIGFLGYIDGTTYATWQHIISPNAVISIIVTATKAAVLSLVASCISQLKWNRYQSATPTRLYDMQLLDQASRGPWGALDAIWSMTPGLATVGALLMVCSMAIDSFAQQMLAFPSRSTLALNETAFIQVAQEYGHIGSGGIRSSSQMESKMQMAIWEGLSQKYKPLEPACTSGNCQYPGIVTLGVCSKCEDITQQTKQSCIPEPRWAGQGFDDMPMNCTYTTESGFQFVAKIVQISQSGANMSNAVHLHGVSWTSIVNKHEDTPVLGIQQPLVSFFAAKYLSSTFYTTENITVPEEKPIMSQCAVYLCERKYKPSANSHGLWLEKSQQLLHNGTNNNIYNKIVFNPAVKLFQPNGSETLSTNSTYFIYGHAFQDLNLILEHVLNISSNDWVGVSDALFNLPDLGKGMDTMASSLSDFIRADSRAIKVPGKAFRDETYIHVRWPWIILPTAMVIFSIVLFIVTAIASRNLHAVLWKTSVLPLLICQLETDPEHGVCSLRNMDEVQRVSKNIRVNVEDKGPLVLSEKSAG